MSVGRICTRVVATAAPDETVRAAAERMAEFDVGTGVGFEVDGYHVSENFRPKNPLPQKWSSGWVIVQQTILKPQRAGIGRHHCLLHKVIR